MVKELIKSMRPHQWAKNLLIFGPLLFALKLWHLPSVLSSLVVFVAFCVLSGSIYILNDLIDLEQDRLHPHKCHRPIASGRLPPQIARRIWPILVIVAIMITLIISWTSALIAISYFGLNLAYTLRIKHLPYLDVLTIATGFLLRVMIGTTAIQVEISRWLLPCTFALALYLALGKRRHELSIYGNQGTRPVLSRYNIKQLDLALGIVASLTVLAYCGYTLDPSTIRKFHTPYLTYTIPMIVFGIVRFLQLMERGVHTESPTQELLKDIPSLFNVILWVLAVIYILYFRPGSDLLCITY